MADLGSVPGLGRSPGREWQPTAVFLPGELHGQKNLVVYIPWDHKELDTTEHAKSWLIGKDSDAGSDWGQEEKGTTEDVMAGWHHRLDGHEFE